MNNEPVAWFEQDPDMKSVWYQSEQDNPNAIPLYTHPAKELTDEEWNKAFDFYCETDEGVLKFDLELRDEWKKEQLIRWKESLRKAQE
jgi:hypothetical protein